MATKYTKVNQSYDAKVHGGYLYVRTTGMNALGMLVQGDRVGTIYRMPYAGTLEDAIKNPIGCGDDYMSAMNNCTMGGKGEVIKEGRLIR
jgi:hypothetical protein